MRFLQSKKKFCSGAGRESCPPGPVMQDWCPQPREPKSQNIIWGEIKENVSPAERLSCQTRFWHRTFRAHILEVPIRGAAIKSHTIFLTRFSLSTIITSKNNVDVEKGNIWNGPYPMFLPRWNKCPPGPPNMTNLLFPKNVRNCFKGPKTPKLACSSNVLFDVDGYSIDFD